MGNEQSSPPPPPPPPPAPTPAPAPPPAPVIPVCDANCQRQKRLDGLKAAMDQSYGTDAYEEARIAYYTELNGQEWLVNEKERIAREEIEPTISGYSNKFKTLTEQKKNQGNFMNLLSLVNYEQQGNEEEVKFLNKQIAKDKTQTDVQNRLNELANQPTESAIIPLILDIVLVIMGLVIVYMLFKKVGGFFQSNGSAPLMVKTVPY